MSPKQVRRALSIAPVIFALSSFACSNKLLGIASSIAVTPMVLDFGSTTVGTPASITVSISNGGSAALTIATISITSNPNSDLSLSAMLTNDCNNQQRSGSTTLAPGECATFVATWTPTSGHPAAGSVGISSNDLQNPAITLPVSGTVASVPTCNPACTATQACCNLTCVDTQSDPTHCGGCGGCASGQSCNSGLCITPSAPTGCDDLTAPCPSPQKCCDHSCTEVGDAGVCPCAPGGISNFGPGSIIIPMDECWQRGVDVTTLPSYCTDNAKTTLNDAPLKAYGLIFFLIRHQVSVNVVIDANKTSIDAIDMALISLGGGPPVERYNWSTGQAVALADATQTTVQYRGGPFLIDSSQHDRVMQLLASDPDFAQFRSAGTITIHVANVGFQSAVAKSIDAVPSSIAFLSPAESSNGEGTCDMGACLQILVNYLDSAGLNFSGAAGTSAAPGQIYDVLQESDFLPNYAGSKLKANGYKMLWAPHWEGGTNNTAAQLATIADYVKAGGDFFAECAAIGTLEGFANSAFGASGSAATRFMTTAGLAGNALNESGQSGTYVGPFTYSGLASTFVQLGDFPFAGFPGYVEDFYPPAPSVYNPGVVRFITGSYSSRQQSGQSDLFTSLDQHSTGEGTVVYLAGHDYSYASNQGAGARGGYPSGVTAGSRLVLNTLFSLGTNNVCQP